MNVEGRASECERRSSGGGGGSLGERERGCLAALLIGRDYYGGMTCALVKRINTLEAN